MSDYIRVISVKSKILLTWFYKVSKYSIKIKLLFYMLLICVMLDWLIN